MNSGKDPFKNKKKHTRRPENSHSERPDRANQPIEKKSGVKMSRGKETQSL